MRTSTFYTLGYFHFVFTLLDTLHACSTKIQFTFSAVSPVILCLRVVFSFSDHLLRSFQYFFVRVETVTSGQIVGRKVRIVLHGSKSYCIFFFVCEFFTRNKNFINTDHFIRLSLAIIQFHDSAFLIFLQTVSRII